MLGRVIGGSRLLMSKDSIKRDSLAGGRRQLMQEDAEVRWWGGERDYRCTMEYDEEKTRRLVAWCWRQQSEQKGTNVRVGVYPQIPPPKRVQSRPHLDMKRMSTCESGDRHSRVKGGLAQSTVTLHKSTLHTPHTVDSRQVAQGQRGR